MRGNLLRLLNRPAVLEVRGDPRRPEGVTADRHRQPRRLRPLRDHPVDIHAVHLLLTERAAPRERAEEGALPVPGDPGSFEILINILLRIVIGRNHHRLLLVLYYRRNHCRNFLHFGGGHPADPFRQPLRIHTPQLQRIYR